MNLGTLLICKFQRRSPGLEAEILNSQQARKVPPELLVHRRFG